MNKRLPLLLSLLALILLAASIAYWVLQLYKPEQRRLAAAPSTAQAAPSPDAAATLIGGHDVQVAMPLLVLVRVTVMIMMAVAVVMQVAMGLLRQIDLGRCLVRMPPPEQLAGEEP